MNDFDAPNDIETGDVIDNKYVLLRKIGKGGMGIVFEAKHRDLLGKVAVKFLMTSNWNGAEEQKRFLSEARVGQKLESEYSVRVTDGGRFFKRNEFFPYIVMEYLEGKNLGDLVEVGGSLAVPVAVDYILQACIALAEAHGKGILHRDLKPSNLFLANRIGTPIVKVLDFGLAKDSATVIDSAGKPMTQSGMIAGTPGYMPWEQLRGLSHTCRQTDIFSLAACLYYLLTGIQPFGPFEGDELPDVTGRVWNGEPPPPMHSFRPDIPPGLVHIVVGALVKEPANRPPSIVEFARTLVPFGSADAARLFGIVERAAQAASEAATHEPLTIPIVNAGSRPPETEGLARTQRMPDRMRSQRTVMIAAIAALVALLTALVVLILQGGSDVPKQVISPPIPSISAPITPLPSATPSQSAPIASVSASVSASASSGPSPSPAPSPVQKTNTTQKDKNKF